MALGIGQATASGTGTSASTTTTGITTTVGSGLVVALFFSSGQPFTTVTDSKGNGDPVLIDNQQSNGPGRCRFYYWPRLKTAGSGHTFTVSVASSVTPAPSIAVCEVTTAGLGIQLNQKSSYVLDTSSPYATNSITTTQGTEMLINFSTVDGIGTTNHTDSGASFTVRSEMADSNNGFGVALASRLVTSIGTYNANWTVSGTVTGVGGIVASFIEVQPTATAWLRA